MTIPLLRPLAHYFDPRRSLACAIGWLTFTLSIGLVLVASVWVDDIVRTDLLDQREKQLKSAADQIAAGLNLNLALRQQSVRTLAALLSTELRDEKQATIRRILDNLQQTTPEFQWIGIASPQGRIIAATNGVLEGTSVADQTWFTLGLKESKTEGARPAPWVAETRVAATGSAPGVTVDLIASVADSEGKMLGVIRAQLGSRWVEDVAQTLGPSSRGPKAAQALVVDPSGTVLIGPTGYQGRRWNCADKASNAAVFKSTNDLARCSPEYLSRVELLADGTPYLVAQASLASSDAVQAVDWGVLVMQPMQEATRRASILQSQITAILLGLGLLTALLGVLLARRVTRDLGAIARSADEVRAGTAHRIAVPGGRNEAARLGRALDGLLISLQSEHSALLSLNAELDQRVAVRTREFESMADQARYDAVVRERLKIARDLHDTLAHSMMAMLTEIRYLKRLFSTNPAAMVEELTRAEETAHQGLKEARDAIEQMRFNPVRDAGLATALEDFIKLFVERTGILVDYTSDAPAGSFSDERAETMFRIFEEAMRNVERHARTNRVVISLQAPAGDHGLTLTIADNGIGFDMQAKHPGHYGLAGLREQARLIGAALTIDSTLHQGTTVKIALASFVPR